MEQILLDDIRTIPEKPEGPGDDGNGVFSFIYRGKRVAEVQAKYGRVNCCIKVFKNYEPFVEDFHEKWWGHSTRLKGTLLHEATHIQNVYAMEGLAPRVYAIFQVVIDGKKHWAQLTDDLGHWVTCEREQNELITGPIVEVAEKYGFEVFNDGREYNVVSGKYVDFQGFHLKPNYDDLIKDRLIGVANVGKWGPWMNYHDIPELGIKGGRNNDERVKDMWLDTISFEGQTVLDIGCSEGFFCRYAIDRGAKKVVGIDLSGVAEPAAELSYYLGYNNIDYYPYNLNKEDPSSLGQFDIVFYFSMCQHIGFPDWLKNLTTKLLIFEGNGKGEDKSAISKMADWFEHFEEKGMTTDLMERPVIWGIQLK